MKKYVSGKMFFTLLLIGIMMTSVATVGEAIETNSNQRNRQVESNNTTASSVEGTEETQKQNHLENSSDLKETDQSTVNSSQSGSKDLYNTETSSQENVIQENPGDSGETSDEKPTIDEKEINRYVTVNNTEAVTYKDLSGDVFKQNSEIMGKTYYAKKMYTDSNGHSYLSIYAKDDISFGYIDENAVELCDGPQGAYQSYWKYVNVTSKDYSVLNDFSGNIINTTENIFENTYQARGKYQHFDGTTYLSLYDNNGKWVGYVDEKATEVCEGRQGAYKPYWEYVTVTNKYYEVFGDFSWDVINTTKNIFNKTYQARGKYKHFNGSTYLSLYDNSGKWCGYVNEKATELGTGRQGAYQSYWKYVTVTNKYYEVFNSFSWNKVNDTKNIFGKTYQARGRYQHFNGSTYLSLYDNSGNFKGYVNEQATSLGSGRQGAIQTTSQYVSITSKNYDIFNNFSWNKLNSTKNVIGKTYQVRGKYQHFNESTYLSLYDNNGKWCGYVNENATMLGEGRQGAYQKYGKYVAITNKYYEIFNNFSWNKVNTTANVFEKTYEAKGKYQHLNGSTYLSLYDNNGKWSGYVNEKATQVVDGRQGIYHDLNKYVIVTSRNYDMFRNFNWEIKQSSSNVYNKGLVAKGKYIHMNGSIYYSVYDGSGNWQGYINANATRIVTYKENYAPYYSQMDVGAINGCAATALYTALRAKNYAQNVSLISFIDGMPLSDSDPDVGQIGNPWGTTTFRQVISPIGLNNYASRYTTNTEIISGSSIDRVISEINSGNQILYWGVYAMRDPYILRAPNHVMIARGYKIGDDGREYILIQEPGVYSYSAFRIRWYEKNAFDSYLTSKYRKMMVVR